MILFVNFMTCQTLVGLCNIKCCKERKSKIDLTHNSSPYSPRKPLPYAPFYSCTIFYLHFTNIY